MKIKLTETAEKSFYEIVRKYTEKKTAEFSKTTFSVIKIISENNKIGARHQKTSYRKFLISNQVYLFYKIKIDVIYVVLFWDNKRNPLMLDIILSS
jgi:hypothetical protein